MTKAELVAEIAKISGSKKEAEATLNAIFYSIKGALSTGEEVRLTGFGSFKINARASRTGRNPRTGKEIKIAARKVAAFKPGKELKEAVNA